MARIRTVKPEFWTDEKVVECSIAARLLFIGLFNFANDRGCMERSPKRIKMQVFPADSIDCEPLIAELINHGLLTEYSVSGTSYLYIRGFLKHQKINRPSKSTIPLPPEFTESMAESGGKSGDGSHGTHGGLIEDSPTGHGGLTDGKGKGREKERINPEREERATEFPPVSPGDFPAAPPAEPFGKFPITEVWEPGPDFVRQAALWGISLGDEPGYTAEELHQFRDYWICEGKVKHQTQWEQTFAQSLRTSRSAARARKPGGSSGHGVSVPDTSIPNGFS